MKPRDAERLGRSLALIGSFIRLYNLVSAVRYKRFKSVVATGLPYHRKVEELLAHLFEFYREEGVHPLLRRVLRPRRVDVVLFFSKRGFVGDFNRLVLKMGLKFAEDFEEVSFFAVGEMGRKYLRGLEAFLFPSPVGNDGSFDYESFKRFVETFRDRFALRKTDKVIFVYATPRVAAETGKPPEFGRKGKAAEEVVYTFEPEKAFKRVKLSPGGGFEVRLLQFLPPPKPKKAERMKLLNVEGCRLSLLGALLKLYLFFNARFVFFESLAAETLARLNTTSAINRRIEEKIKELTLLKFKLKREAIDEELRNIHAAAEALRGATGNLSELMGVEEILGVSPMVWETLGERLKELFPSARVGFEEVIGFKFRRLNYRPNFEKPSVSIDGTVCGNLEELLKYLLR